jgi:hypothetical protein
VKWVVALLFVLPLAFLGGYLASAQPPSSSALPASKWDDQMIQLDKQALDQAYVDQLQHLFMIWMKDESGQPNRAITGARQARRAYIEVMNEIEKREKK